MSAISKKGKSTVLQAVIDAIRAIGKPQKGASYIAIRNWIKGTGLYQESRLTSLLRNAIEKGLETGQLKRTAASKDKVGLTGNFTIQKSKVISAGPRPTTTAGSSTASTTRSKLSTSKNTGQPKAAVKLKRQDVHHISPVQQLVSKKQPTTKKTKQSEKVAMKTRPEAEENVTLETANSSNTSEEATNAAKSKRNDRNTKVMIRSTGVARRTRAAQKARELSDTQGELPSSAYSAKPKKRGKEEKNTGPNKLKQVKVKRNPLKKQVSENVDVPGTSAVTKESKKVGKKLQVAKGNLTKSKNIRKVKKRGKIDNQEVVDSPKLNETFDLPTVAEFNRDIRDSFDLISARGIAKDVSSTPTNHVTKRFNRQQNILDSFDTSIEASEIISDTELSIRRVSRMSLKSYSSETNLAMLQAKGTKTRRRRKINE